MSRRFEVHQNLADFHETLCDYFRKYVEKIQDASKSGENKDLCTFIIISRSILLRTRNVSNKNCRENQNTHFMFNNVFFKIVPIMRPCGKIL